MSYSRDDLLFAPLGGSGEIGMNVNLYHFRDSWIMVDLGISFPDESTPGVDVILPDLKFIADRREQLAGLVLTHGHEDHFGAIPYLWSLIGCPVYGSAFTIALGSCALACAVPPKALMNSGNASSLLLTLASSCPMSKAGARRGDIRAAMTRRPK